MSCRSRASRAGFTLIELLVVIALIALLASLAITVVGNLLSNAKENATEATLKKVNDLLQQRLDAFQRRILEQTQSGGTPAFVAENPAAINEAAGNFSLAVILGQKREFAKLFPMTFVEAEPDITPGGSHVTATAWPGSAASTCW